MKANLLKSLIRVKKLHLIGAIAVCLFLFNLSCKKAVLTTPDTSDKRQTLSVNQVVYSNVYNGVNYSSTQPYNLNVIYFLPNDVPLDPTYKTRLSALMLYTQDFYKQNMINNGYGSKTFGLFTETANPKNVQILLVRGQHPMSYYPYSSSTNEQAEVNAFLSQNPTLKTSVHNLIITAVPDPNTADVPYYGIKPNCFALDYPQLDIKYLGTTGTYGDLFVKWFGGMVHELGHGLNLPHSHQTNTENNNPAQGMNLMFAGNGTLGRQPTFINRASCSILNNCQAFATTSGGTYYNGHISGLTSLHASYSNGNLVVSGTYQSNVTVTDINIYQDPYATPSPGYYRVAWSVKPGSGNSFTATMPVSELQQPANGPYNLEIELVLTNGEYTLDSYGYSYNNGVPTINVNFDPIANGTYKLTNLASGKSLDNMGLSANGSGVAIYTTNPSNNQKWVLTSSNGYYRIQSVANGKSLDSGNNTADGSSIIQYDNLSNTNQQWTLMPVGGGYYEIINRTNGKAMDSAGATADGSFLKFWTVTNSNNQKWTITP